MRAARVVMVVKDVLMLGVVFPALVVPLWIVVVRVWRQGRDIYDQAGPVKWVTPESARHGYHAFLLPAVISMTLSGPVTAAYVVWEHGGLQWLGEAFIWLYALCFGFLLVGFWLWAFMWPRFLVPPHLRGQRGWVLAALRGPSEKFVGSGEGGPPRSGDSGR